MVERDGQEFTYELMFSLRDVRTVFVPYEDLNPMLGWSAAATVREANVYSADRAAGLIDALGGSGPQTPQNLQREPPGVQVLPVEARDVESYVLQRPNEPSTAVRREAELVQTYVMWRSASGAETCRHGIRFPEGTTLYTDLFDIELDELLEAKASSARHHVRTGLGQILDYSRFVSSRSRALLLPDEPIDDLKELLTQNHVAVVWPHGDGFVRLEPQSEDNLVAAEADA
ncbi:hypothetical protein [Nocardioides nitrophenolicus]|uniref:hypothetical protein n=1 Tax=Nocardioides nitrophenolicus TaxID=60489 RepID=UPI00195A95B3|nr:hypothetical protein [Nocardioides nitrophenolicus]MBM7519511.1 hypothetical protein [Nocardioides nitrophenolicus]